LVAVVGCGRRGRGRRRRRRGCGVVDACVQMVGMDSAALESHRAARRRDLVIPVCRASKMDYLCIRMVYAAHSVFGGRKDPA